MFSYSLKYQGLIVNYQTTPVRSDFLIKVRQVGLDDQNQAVVTIVAKGGEPCRDALRRANAGEKLILASYCRLSKPGPYKEYGPIFVLANQAKDYVNFDKLPFSTHLINDYFGKIFVLKAYDKYESIIAAQLVSTDNVEQIIGEYFQQPTASFLIARYAEYGCYSLRLDRKH